MRKISAEMPSNPQQNHCGIESNASPAMDVGRVPDVVCATAVAGRWGGQEMRAVSFFGAGWLESVTGGCGCKTGEAATCAGNADGDRSGRMTGVVSSFWGSTGSAMTNHVVSKKSLKIPALSLANFLAFGGTWFCTSDLWLTPIKILDVPKHVPPRGFRPTDRSRDCR
jgi:hypothetical protein